MEVIRKLEIEDIDEIIPLRIGIQNYDLKYIDDDEIILSQDELIEETKKYLVNSLNNSLYMFGLFIDNELVSNCGFYIDKHFPTYDNPSGITGFICNVFTKDDFRRKGYQKKVFTYCFDYAKNMGITNFKLSTLNQDAINLYESFGFEKSNSTYSLYL